MEEEHPFSKSNKLQNVALEIEGKQLWICPQQLAMQSLAFEKLFFGEFKEKNQEIVVLEDEKYEEFAPFLKYQSELAIFWEEISVRKSQKRAVEAGR